MSFKYLKTVLITLILSTFCFGDNEKWIEGEVFEAGIIHDDCIFVRLKNKSITYNGEEKLIFFVINKNDFSDQHYAMHYATILKAAENGTVLTLGYEGAGANENEIIDFWGSPSYLIKTTSLKRY